VKTLEHHETYYRFDASCLYCGGDLPTLAEGRPLSAEVRNIVKCANCGRQYVLSVHLVPLVINDRVRNRNLQAAICGTDPGYFHHVRTNKERACDDCRAAHAEAERERMARLEGRAS
jgi:hypothetical protein